MKASWIEDAILYQVNLRSLAAREPRNPIEAAREIKSRVSPLSYLARSLPVIAKLGVNVVYLMPLYPMGYEQRKGIGSPYSISDFTAVDPEHGTLDELKHVVRRAHALGLKVIMDITPNHTSRDHVWTRRHPEFYVRAPGGGLFHDLDWTDTAKLDYRNPSLRKAMIRVYEFWLGCLGRDEEGHKDGVDGFRLDMAHFINDRSFWNEAMPELRERHASRELLFLAECYGTANNLDLFQRGINAAYDDDFYKVCQYGYAIDESGQSVVKLSAASLHNGDFADKRDAFERGGIAAAATTALLNYETLFSGQRGPWLARYTDNHDEGRGLYRFGPGAVRAVNTLIFLAPRTLPFLLSGQEFGALNRPPIHDRLRPCDKGRRMGSATGETVELGVELEGNVFDRGMEMRRQWYDFYRALTKLRRETPELSRGDFSLLDAGEECVASGRTVLAFERRLGQSAVSCAANLGPDARRLTHAACFAGDVIHGGLNSGGVLPAFSAVVTRRRGGNT